MSVPYDKYRALVEKLYRLTDEKSLSWSISSYDNELFTSLGRYKVILEWGEDADGSPLITVTLKNDNGVTIDTFSDTTISGKSPEIPGFDSYWRLMSALHTSAHRNATGADEALDEILKALDDEEVPF